MMADPLAYLFLMLMHTVILAACILNLRYGHRGKALALFAFFVFLVAFV